MEWNQWRKKTEEEIWLEGAKLEDAHLENAKLEKAHLEGAELVGAHLEGAKLIESHLEGADLCVAHLEDANLNIADLEGADFTAAFVNSATSILGCSIDRETDFREVSLDTIRIKQETKQLLEYNIRRMNWDEWYKGHPKLKWLVKPFWLMSDYGLSTGRIIVTFFALAFVFANIYYHWGRIAPPGIVNNLFVDRNGIEVQWWLVPLRTLYFSIVTMTTLGFGDMYANAQSILGHLLLMLQVILGYALLGALVTRFAVLFTAGGPAGSYTPMDKETKELLAKLKEDKGN